MQAQSRENLRGRVTRSGVANANRLRPVLNPTPDNDPDTLIAKADADPVLCEASRFGRNRVQIHAKCRPAGDVQS